MKVGADASDIELILGRYAMRTLRSLFAVLLIAVITAGCTVVVTPATAPDAPTIAVSTSGVASTVTLAAVTSGSFVYYTTDGSTPTTSSTLYSSPFVIAGFGVTKTVTAIAYASGLYSTAATKTVTVGSTLGQSGASVTSNFATGLTSPWGVVSDGTNVYVADTSNNQIRKVVIATGSNSLLAGSGVASSIDGTGTTASFNYPVGLATDGTNLFVTEYYGNKIRKIVISSGVVTTLAGSNTAGHADGTGTAATFNIPVGITTDGENLYVAEYGNHMVRKIAISSAVVTTLAGTAGIAGHNNGTGTAASFSSPHFLTTDGTNLFVADYGNSYIRKIVISSGVVTDAQNVGGLIGITTDGTNLFITDFTNGEVVKYAIGASTGATIATGLNQPMGIASDGTNLYVADSSNNKVVVIK